MSYPVDLLFLKPYADQCELIGTGEDCEIFVGNLSSSNKQSFVDLYKQLVDQQAGKQLDAWLENDTSEEGSAVFRLLVLLDYLATTGEIPEPQASTRFIEWDDREFDDEGNEW